MDIGCVFISDVPNSVHILSVYLCTDSSLLPSSVREACAHMLAAIHLKLRTKDGLLPAYNCTFQYLSERLAVC